MRKLILVLLINGSLLALAKSNLTTSVIEVGRTLVDLVRVFRVPKTMLYPSARNSTATVDSFYSKGLADVSYKTDLAQICRLVCLNVLEQFIQSPR